MERKKIIIGTNTLLNCARTLLDRGEITQKEFEVMQKRNENIKEDYKKDIVVIS